MYPLLKGAASCAYVHALCQRQGRADPNTARCRPLTHADDASGFSRARLHWVRPGPPAAVLRGEVCARRGRLTRRRQRPTRAARRAMSRICRAATACGRHDATAVGLRATRGGDWAEPRFPGSAKNLMKEPWRPGRARRPRVRGEHCGRQGGATSASITVTRAIADGRTRLSSASCL